LLPAGAVRKIARMLGVLTPDYDYWRARRSPVEARGIQVHIGASGSGLDPAVHRALWQAFNSLDWAALSKLLELPQQAPVDARPAGALPSGSLSGIIG